MTTNIATVVDFERVASDKVWAELDTANKRIAALEESLRDCARALEMARDCVDMRVTTPFTFSTIDSAIAKAVQP